MTTADEFNEAAARLEAEHPIADEPRRHAYGNDHFTWVELDDGQIEYIWRRHLRGCIGGHDAMVTACRYLTRAATERNDH